MTKSSKKGSIPKNKDKKDVYSTFQLKDFVFAKTVAHPPWPARIIKVKEDHIYRVDFIGVKYYADMYEAGLEPFNEKTVNNYLKIYDKNAKLKKSIGIAMNRLQNEDRKSSKNNSSSVKKSKKTKKIEKTNKSKKREKEESSEFEDSSQNISEVEEQVMSEEEEGEERESKSYSHPPPFTSVDKNKKKGRINKVSLPVIKEVGSKRKVIKEEESSEGHEEEEVINQEKIYDEEEEEKEKEKEKEEEIANSDSEKEEEQNLEAVNYNVKRRKMNLDSSEEQEEESKPKETTNVKKNKSEVEELHKEKEKIEHSKTVIKIENFKHIQKSSTEKSVTSRHEIIIEEDHEERKVQNSPEIKLTKIPSNQEKPHSKVELSKQSIYHNQNLNLTQISPKRKPVLDEPTHKQSVNKQQHEPKSTKESLAKKHQTTQEPTKKLEKIVEEKSEQIKENKNINVENLPQQKFAQQSKSPSISEYQSSSPLNESESIHYRFFKDQEEQISESESSSSFSENHNIKEKKIVYEKKEVSMTSPVISKKSRRATQLLLEEHRRKKDKIKKLKICEGIVSAEIKLKPYNEDLYQYETKFNNIYQCTYFDKQIVAENMRIRDKMRRERNEARLSEVSNKSVQGSCEAKSPISENPKNVSNNNLVENINVEIHSEKIVPENNPNEESSEPVDYASEKPMVEEKEEKKNLGYYKSEMINAENFRSPISKAEQEKIDNNKLKILAKSPLCMSEESEISSLESPQSRSLRNEQVKITKAPESSILKNPLFSYYRSKIDIDEENESSKKPAILITSILNYLETSKIEEEEISEILHKQERIEQFFKENVNKDQINELNRYYYNLLNNKEIPLEESIKPLSKEEVEIENVWETLYKNEMVQIIQLIEQENLKKSPENQKKIKINQKKTEYQHLHQESNKDSDIEEGMMILNEEKDERTKINQYEKYQFMKMISSNKDMQQIWHNEEAFKKFLIEKNKEETSQELTKKFRIIIKDFIILIQSLQFCSLKSEKEGKESICIENEERLVFRFDTLLHDQDKQCEHLYLVYYYLYFELLPLKTLIEGDIIEEIIELITVYLRQTTHGRRIVLYLLLENKKPILQLDEKDWIKILSKKQSFRSYQSIENLYGTLIKFKIDIRKVFSKLLKLKIGYPQPMSLKESPSFIDRFFQLKNVNQFMDLYSEKMSKILRKIDNLKEIWCNEDFLDMNKTEEKNEPNEAFLDYITLE